MTSSDEYQQKQNWEQMIDVYTVYFKDNPKDGEHICKYIVDNSEKIFIWNDKTTFKTK